MPPEDRFPLSPVALFRYQAVCAVEVCIDLGMSLGHAVTEVAGLPLRDVCGQTRRLSERSLYRWVKAYRADGIEALENEPRQKIADSAVLPPELVEFIRVEKQRDTVASIPELLRRAERKGIVAEDESVSRVSVWRACRRMELPTARRKKAGDDKRRFSYPNRMLMVLADGKHFRAGVNRSKRVALNFLDDACRFGLNSIVGTSENTELFLQGLYQTISKYGLMCALYLDHGAGFISADTMEVVARLGIRLIHGTSAYPEGHGKIERFHRTLLQHCVRGLDRNPEVNPELASLSLRLTHWTRDIYNHTHHETLKSTPAERWSLDSRPLDFPKDPRWVENQFILSFERRVSKDNIISYEATPFELPQGYAGQRLIIFRNLLTSDVSIIHDGRRVILHPVDPVRNAYAKRGARSIDSPNPSPPVPTTAAAMAFDSTFKPLVDDEGNFPDSKESDDEK